MQVFQGASRVKIERGNFSNVGRDQINRTTFHARKIIIQNHWGNGEVSRLKTPKRLELSEYTEVKRGDIYKIRDIYHKQHYDSQPNKKGNKEEEIYIAEVTVNGSSHHTRALTVKTFYGPLAQKRWKQEYFKFSRDR
ncbi:hypothetical protein L218DRAFT_956985 [Marasmius fiardii PR-910]|nr:hypothetical protein L218DRAFT_956985 [Marasmius fiardii PR-910]